MWVPRRECWLSHSSRLAAEQRPLQHQLGALDIASLLGSSTAWLQSLGLWVSAPRAGALSGGGKAPAAGKPLPPAQTHLRLQQVGQEADEALAPHFRLHCWQAQRLGGRKRGEGHRDGQAAGRAAAGLPGAGAGLRTRGANGRTTGGDHFDPAAAGGGLGSVRLNGAHKWAAVWRCRKLRLTMIGAWRASGRRAEAFDGRVV